jgi:hypothetical protein
MAGLAFAVLSFFLTVLVFRLGDPISAAVGLNSMLTLLLLALLLSVLLTFIFFRFIFRSRWALTPLFFSLSAAYMLLFVFAFYYLTSASSTWSGFIFIFMYLPVIMAAVSWLYYFSYRIFKK